MAGSLSWGRRFRILGIDDGHRQRQRAEIASRAMLEWTNRTGFDWHYIASGKPQQNGFVERFNGKLRDECLNEEAFSTLAEARAVIGDRLLPGAPTLGPRRPHPRGSEAESRGRPAAQHRRLRRPTATADATDQLSTLRALTMIEGPEGSRSLLMIDGQGEMKPVAVIELNELNFEYVQRYISAGRLPGFKALLENSALDLTTSEERYDEWEPWIQWVTAHTGQPLAEHGIFRLGDGGGADIEQIWERLEKLGLRVGALSPMNARNRLNDPAFFLPDPWTETPMAAPDALKRVYSAIARAVSQNAEGRMDTATLVTLALGLIRFARPINYYQYISLAASSLAKPWLRAVFLDLFLGDVFVRLKKGTRPDFSTAFFNAGAHIQHHYMFSSAAYPGERKNPNWYVKPGSDPLLDVYKAYDRIISDLLREFPETRFMIATGLHQVPHESETFYWRLKNHDSFLSSAGVPYAEVHPLMSRDFVVRFSSAEDAAVAEKMFIEAVASDGGRLFNVDNRGTEIFLELAYAKDIPAELTWHFNSKTFSGVRDLVAFVAIKNGAHNGVGYFIDTGAESRTPERFPLSELVDKVLAACGVQGTAGPPPAGQPVS